MVPSEGEQRVFNLSRYIIHMIGCNMYIYIYICLIYVAYIIYISSICTYHVLVNPIESHEKHWKTTIFLWFSYGCSNFPMVFLWFHHIFPPSPWSPWRFHNPVTQVLKTRSASRSSTRRASARASAGMKKMRHKTQ